jgi:hypothetical protein
MPHMHLKVSLLGNNRTNMSAVNMYHCPPLVRLTTIVNKSTFCGDLKGVLYVLKVIHIARL